MFVVLSTSFFSLGASIAYSIITYIRKRKSLAGSRLRVQTVPNYAKLKQIKKKKDKNATREIQILEEKNI